MSLPLVGEVTAAGKKVIDFQHELVRRYEGKLEDNEVLVTWRTDGNRDRVGIRQTPGRNSF